MHLLNILLILCSVTSLVLSKPYQYSYYLSLPGNYQSLAVRDGAVSINNGPPLIVAPAPGLGQGVDPVFRQNPGLDGQFPLNPGILGNPNFRQIGLNNGFSQNPAFGGRFPVIPGNQIRPQGLNPAFNQYPGFGRRFPNQNEPDFTRGRDDPDKEDIPDGELDPNRPFPRIPNIPDFRNGRRYPDEIPNGELDPQFTGRGPYSPEFGTRVQPIIPRRRAISRREKPLNTNGNNIIKPQEIDERNNTDREEITTPQPCSFCGVDKINPMDGIDVSNINPDSEPVEPKNIGGVDPGFVIQNNIGIPASVGGPGYINSPFVNYYGLSSL